LDEYDFEILKKSKISGSSMLSFKEHHFYKEGLAAGPTIAIMDFITKLKKGNYFMVTFTSGIIII